MPSRIVIAAALAAAICTDAFAFVPEHSNQEPPVISARPQTPSDAAEEAVEAELARLTETEASLRGNPTAFSAEQADGARRLADDAVRAGNDVQQQRARNLLGVIYMHLSRYSDALAQFQSIELSHATPLERALYLYNRGRAQERTGQLDNALTDFRSALTANPGSQPAASGIFRVLEQSGRLTPSTAAEVCTTMLALGGTVAADRCFLGQLDRWAREPQSRDLLTYVVSRYADGSVAADVLSATVCADASEPARDDAHCLDVAVLRARYPGWSAPLEELRVAIEGAHPTRFDRAALREQFPTWASDGERRAFAAVLAASGRRFRRALERSEGRAQDLIERAVGSYASAWALDESDVESARQAVFLTGQLVDARRRKDLTRAFAEMVASTMPPVEAGADQSKAWSALYESVGTELARFTPCGGADSPEAPLYYWSRALISEARANGTSAAGLPFVGSSVPLVPPSQSLALNRRLAGCYGRAGVAELHRTFETAVRLELEKTFRASFENKLRFHRRSMIYPGGILKSSLQAGFQQAMGTPSAWGQGLSGYGRRVVSSQATRAVRQAMALGLDTYLREDPRFVQAPSRDTAHRLWHAVRQTLVCPGDDLGSHFNWWRVGSAVGSELASNAWRPAGDGLGDRGVRAAVSRAGYVLIGDTVSAVFREFLPRRGRLGVLVRRFI